MSSNVLGSTNGNNFRRQGAAPPARVRERLFWRVEGSLLDLTAVRPVGFFSWNAQTFSERWARRGAMGILGLTRPLLYAINRKFATRVLHMVLRGVSRDRLDLLGEEYFDFALKPRLKRKGVEELEEAMATGAEVVLVSQGLDHIMRPLADHLGVKSLACNRLDFRDGISTGRLLDPVIRPRGVFAKMGGNRADGRIDRRTLLGHLGFAKKPEELDRAVYPAVRQVPKTMVPVVHFAERNGSGYASVREALRGKHILLIGGTGFIGKVWLTHLLSDLPEIGRITLLVRGHKTATAFQRFRRIVEESPVLEELAALHGQNFAAFVRERVEVVDGDSSRPGLGISAENRARLAASVDLVVNSAGLTDFNPDLRDALASNVRSMSYLLEFLKSSKKAALLHLSTCYVVGRRDGRVLETLEANYTPKAIPRFDALKEWESLERLVEQTEAHANSQEVGQELLQYALKKEKAAKDLHGAALENQIRKNRVRWLRQTLSEAGTRRANELGWPNTYTFTKSLAESMVRHYLDSNPEAAIAVVRPAIVESSVGQPFLGWNEGINTSASLSYLLGTFFRQLPTNEHKCLDLVPVDLVSRGMTLIAAALVTRRNAEAYQLATSVANPCDMRRSIELTGLGHRRFYRAQPDFQLRMKAKFDAIPVSKTRYDAFSAPAQKAIVQAINRSIEPIPFVRSPFARQERELEKVIKLIALFEPFILHNNHIFEAANVERLSAMLPPEEQEKFGYDARSLDWWDYWINVHIPALRKWCYPLIEGRKPPTVPRREVPLDGHGSSSGTAAPDHKSSATAP